MNNVDIMLSLLGAVIFYLTSLGISKLKKDKFNSKKLGGKSIIVGTIIFIILLFNRKLTIKSVIPKINPMEQIIRTGSPNF